MEGNVKSQGVIRPNSTTENIVVGEWRDLSTLSYLTVLPNTCISDQPWFLKLRKRVHGVRTVQSQPSINTLA